jgi:mono/diheme cytochrome c family protein
MPQSAKYLKPVGAMALCLVALLVNVEAGSGPPQAPPDVPASELTFTGTDVFKGYCAVCHGTSARGDGPLADKMKRRPPDLTMLATQNGGVFPAEQVRKVIDGREPAPGHGGPDMPVWGSAFKSSRLGSSEESVKSVIDALVKHIESMQQKPAQ